MPIQVLKPKFHVDECLDQVRECLEKGWTGMGFKTVEFEEEWKKYTGHKYAYYLSSNTVGLHLAVKVLKMNNGWKDGDEIISTPITFVSTNLAIEYENLHPVFADVDEYLCLDPIDVEKKITDKTRAVIFVGYGGRSHQTVHVDRADGCRRGEIRRRPVGPHFLQGEGQSRSTYRRYPYACGYRLGIRLWRRHLAHRNQ